MRAGGCRAVAAICANGLGHFRRSTGVLIRLCRRQPDLRVDIVCEQWQLQWMAAEPTTKELLGSPGVRFVHGIVAPGVAWSADPRTYADGRLVGWIERLARLDGLDAADLVISDNLAGVLALRGDAVLLGSFLWSDVLAAAYPKERAVIDFVKHERELLARCRPPMLCVDGLVMPGVLERTTAVRLPLMCPDAPARPPDDRSARRTPRIALLAGAAGAADAALAAAGAAVARALGVEIAAPEGLRRGETGQQADVAFAHRPEDFLGCDLAICRPAAGAIHDCIAFQLPMVMLHEPGNVELAHNGRRAEELELGRYLGAEAGTETIVEAVREMLAPARIEGVRARMMGMPKNGLGKAAAWLGARLAGERERAAAAVGTR